MISEERITRASSEATKPGIWQAPTHMKVPISMATGLMPRPSNSRAPLQVKPQATKRSAFARSIDKRSDNEPCDPKSQTDMPPTR